MASGTLPTRCSIYGCPDPGAVTLHATDGEWRFCAGHGQRYEMLGYAREREDVGKRSAQIQLGEPTDPRLRAAWALR